MPHNNKTIKVLKTTVRIYTFTSGNSRQSAPPPLQNTNSLQYRSPTPYYGADSLSEFLVVCLKPQSSFIFHLTLGI